MSYQVHNFQTGDVIEAFPVNEMDAQIQLNETNIAQKIDISKKGAANGVAELDSSGKVPTSQLPSYVDDVLEYNSRSDFPATGEAGKIYVAKDTNLTYRWSGSDYVEISPSLALGETSATAYRGDRGKTAYDHATESGKISAAVSTNLYKISVTGQGHIGSVTPAEKADLVGLGVLDANQGAANAGKFMQVDADGSLVPSNVDMSAKADKPSNPTDGDLAALDANGNLVDSGKKTSDFVPVTRKINGHALSSDFNISKSDVGLGNVDNTSDANKPVSTAQQTALDGKTDKVSGATNGNFAGLDANGNLTDSGKKASDFLGTSTINDTAGIGDTDKVWSADKLATEENKIKQVISFDPSAMEAAVAGVTGVTTVSINVNNTDETVGDFPARSVAAVVLNGNASSIASAIWNQLPDLYNTYGTFSQSVTDSEGTHTVYFSRPTVYTVGVHVRIKKYDGYDPESVDSDIKTALRTYINESVNIGESLNVLTLHGIVNKTAVAYEGMYEIEDLYCTVGGVDEWVLLSHGWKSKYAVNSVNDIDIVYEDGVEIDDTAGIGDTNSTWSADKMSKDLIGLDGKKANSDNVYAYKDASGAIVTVDDAVAEAVKQIQIEIAPVQDLHGYDAPWPGGGGKNLLENQATSETSSGLTYTVNDDGTVEVSGTSRTSTFCEIGSVTLDSTKEYILNGCPDGGGSSTYHLTISSDTETFEDTGDGVTINPQTSGTFNVYIDFARDVTVNNVTFKPMVRLSSVTDATYAPYSNICPISGWTGCNVTRTGKNLFDPNLTYESGYWGTDGSVVSSANYKRELEYIPVKGNTSYAFQMNKTASTSRVLSICEYDGSKAFIEYTIIIPSTVATTGVVSGTILTKESTKYIRINLPVENVSNIQFEENADATDYEAYAGEEYDIAFPSDAGTVYGGTLTVNKDGTGTLMVNHVKHEMPTSGFSLMYTNEHACVFSRQRNNIWDEAPVGLPNGTIKSNLLKAVQTVNSATDTPYVFSIYNSSNNYIRITLPLSVASTAEQLHTWLTNNPVEVVYDIAEPTTYQLPALEVIEMLNGTNNIWADTGDIFSMLYATNRSYSKEESDSRYYSKEESDERYAEADASYTKEESDALYYSKTESDAQYYSKDESDAKYAGIIDESIVTPAGVASFEDGADGIPMALTVGIEPMQDLHGYDAPWPAGGGKNLIPDGTDTNNGYVAGNILRYDGLTQTVTGYYVSEYFAVQPSTNYVYSHNASEAPDAPAVCFYDENKQFISGSGTKMGRHEYVAVQSPSNAVYARTTQSETYIMQLETGTTPTGVSPYRNICPISGLTGCNIVKAGKNYFDISAVTNSSYYTIVDGIGTSTRAYAASAVRMNNSDLLLKAGMKIVFSADVKISNDSTDTREVVRLGYKLIGSSGSGNTNNSDFTLSGADTWERVSAVRTIADTGIYTFGIQPRYSGHTVMFKNVQIEIGTTTPGDYEPYQGSKYSISFPSSAGTVYGGTLTVNKDGSGKLIVDKICFEYDGTENWLESVSGGGYYLQQAFPTDSMTQTVAPITNKFKWNASISKNMADLSQGEISFAVSSTNRQLNIKAKSIYDTLEAFKASLSNEPLQIVGNRIGGGSLEFDLASEQITSILGINNIYADTGEVLSVDYSADTKEYIDQSNGELREDVNALQEQTAELYEDTGVLHGQTDELYEAVSNLEKGKADIIDISDDTAEGVKIIHDGSDDLPISLTVGIEPLQDLHGFAKPWHSGYGKNLFDGIQIDGYISDDGTEGIDGYNVHSDCIKVTSGQSYTYSWKTTRTGSVNRRIQGYNSEKAWVLMIDKNITDASGSKTFTVPNEVEYIKIQFYTQDDYDIQVESGTIATEYAPYSNICPISGWTGVNVTQAGKNLYKHQKRAYINSAGQEVSQNVSTLTDYIKCASGEKFTFSSSENIVNVEFAQYDKYKNFKSVSGKWTTNNWTFTAQYDGFVRFHINVNNTSGSDENSASYHVMIERGGVVTAYEANKTKTYSITFPSDAGTVYGGTLTVNNDGTGTLVVDRTYLEFDGSSDEPWELKNGDYKFFGLTYAGTERFKNYDEQSYISNRFENIAIGGTTENIGLCIVNHRDFRIRYEVNNNLTVADCRAWLAENPVQVVAWLYTDAYYKTISLTAEQISSLLGVNSIFADTGDILSIAYSADTKEYVDNVVRKFSDFADRIITSDEIVQGTSQTSANPYTIVANAKRIRIKDTIPVKKGMGLYFKPGDTTKKVWFNAYDTSNAYLYNSGWITYETNVLFDADGCVVPVFAKEDVDETIEPSEYDATTKILSVDTAGIERRKYIDSLAGNITDFGDSWDVTHNSATVYKTNKNVVIFGGTKHTGSFRYVLLSDNVARSSSSETGFAAESLTIPLVAGRKYRLVVERLSETSVESGDAWFSIIYAVNGTVEKQSGSGITFNRFANGVKKVYGKPFTAQSNQYGIATVLKSIVYTGAFAIYIEDVTDNAQNMIADYDLPTNALVSHAIGDVFICESKLYRAIDSISVGDAIIVESNVEEIKLSDYIAEIIADIRPLQSNVDKLNEETLAFGMNPLTRHIFPNYEKDVVVNTAQNKRQIDVLYNVVRSIGNPSLTGTTYKGVILSTDGVKVRGRLDTSDITMYKSYFKDIPKPTYSGMEWKLVLHISQYIDRGGHTNTPQFYFFTYDSNGVVNKAIASAFYVDATHEVTYVDQWYVMPDVFTTNGNICSGINFRTPRQTVDRKMEFMYIEASLIPEEMIVLTSSVLDNPVVDDITPESGT